MAVVPYGVRLEQKESEPMVRPIPFAFAFLKLAYTRFSSFSATVSPGYWSCTSGMYGGAYVLNHSFKNWMVGQK